MTAANGPVPVYLASRSPRRRELLEQVGVRYAVVDVEVDERHVPGEAPAAYVRRVATEKALAGDAALGLPAARVLAADTAVILGNAILGKPRDAADARRMLGALSGREHRVLSAVALAAHGECRTALSESRVWMRETSAAERAAYAATGEPLDKAGGYAIQGLGAVFVQRLEGSYSGVMGLPLFETARLLREAGLALLP
jgi:septum formation protein